MIKGLSKKRNREGKRKKRERKRRKKEKKGKKRRKKKGKKGKEKGKKGEKEGNRKKKGNYGFWLTPENKENLFGKKKSYFFPRGKEYHIFSRCECI